MCTKILKKPISQYSQFKFIQSWIDLSYNCQFGLMFNEEVGI